AGEARHPDRSGRSGYLPGGQAGRQGHRRPAAGRPPAGNRLPLYGSRAGPGHPVRQLPHRLCGRLYRPAQGGCPRGGLCPDRRQRPPGLWPGLKPTDPRPARRLLMYFIVRNKGDCLMKARIPQHREFIINFPDSVDQAKASEGWAKLTQIVEDYKKAHNGASVYAPTFIEDCEPEVKKLQEEYGFEYTIVYVQ